MSWIKVINYKEATGRLKKLYDRVKGPDNNVDNVMKAHSLRPHTLAGHMSLYKAVLHNSNNKLPKWYLETIGLYVSMLNECSYCVEHHFQGLIRLLDDENRAQNIRKNLASGLIDEVLDQKYVSGLKYAQKLSQSPPQSSEADIKKLKEAGFTDGQILEINQVVSYFNYANRTVLGLGINVKGDILGLSPNESDDPDDWGHK
jgi:uncharacterized peroxidase-related enzyme